MDCSVRGSRAHSQIAQGLTPFRVPCNCKNSSKARTAYLLAVAEGRGAGHLRTDVRRPICENALVMTFPGLTMIWLLGDQLVGTHSTEGFGTLSKIAKGDCGPYSAIWDVNTKERSTYVQSAGPPISQFFGLSNYILDFGVDRRLDPHEARQPEGRQPRGFRIRPRCHPDTIRAYRRLYVFYGRKQV